MNRLLDVTVTEELDEIIKRAKRVLRKLYKVDGDIRWEIEGYKEDIGSVVVNIYGKDILLMQVRIPSVGSWWGDCYFLGEKRLPICFKKRSRIFFNRCDIPYILAHFYIINALLSQGIPINALLTELLVSRSFPWKDMIEFDIRDRNVSSFKLLIHVPASRGKTIWLDFYLAENKYSLTPKGEQIAEIAEMLHKVIGALLL